VSADNANQTVKERNQVVSNPNTEKSSAIGSDVAKADKKSPVTAQQTGVDIDQRIAKIKNLSTRAQFDVEELSIRNDSNLKPTERSKLLKLIWSEETQKLK
jgi:hypothetical protein